ncbi:hypothetical protein C8A00DRAFT_31683 [Chaetomidium leptoderma]|uniref:Eisosome protein 1 protein n=1 Tax=Chaetomidium leptoderma TaxID=669021 RepID=A0AAN6VS54_9PEZI|nr:hypothetical protein C8A00DRAFT_31683 [Chaetomidium leptoderma]
MTGHSGPLRYANAEDLPSYPSPGLKPGDAAASAAATLGWANTPASPMSAAAAPRSPREHQLGTPRSQDALLAAGWAQRSQKQPPSPPSLWVSTAANLAFSASKTPPPTTERPGLSSQNSMHAAKGAMAGARPRAKSSPQTRTDRNPDHSAGGAALSAATIAHRPSVRANTISAGEAGAVPFTTMDRRMFTSNPPVKLETDEKNRAYVLHASAIAMAKKMYEQQQKIIDNSARAHARSSSFPGGETASLASSRTEEQAPLVYNSLQEAAYRLAQERLGKLQEEHDKQRGLQEYYGSGTPQRTRIGTIKGKLTRRRSSSDGDLLEDKQRSEQIRKQMSLLNNKLSEVDEDKRSRDREALLAAAQRNVKAQLQEMDEKVQSETGRVPQITMDDWGRKALVAAQARYGAVGNDSAGKVDIGGGKLMDRSEVEKIAAKNVQPLLDEINDRVEKERERQEEEKLEEERQKEKVERDRMRDMEVQEIHKKLKDQQKEDERARKAEIKQEEKIRKAEAKAFKAEQKHATKEDKQDILPPTRSQTTGATNPNQSSPETENKPSSAVGRVRALSINFAKRPQRQKGKGSADKPPSPDDSNSTSPTRKVRAWLLSRFPRPRTKSASVAAVEEQDSSSDTKKGFIGGAALARRQGTDVSEVQEPDKGKAKEQGLIPTNEIMRPNSSMRDVAMAGRSIIPEPKGGDEPGESSTTAAAATATAAVISHTTPFTQRPISQVSQASIPASGSDRPVSSLSGLSSSGISRSSSSGRSSDDRFVEARSEPETSGSVVAPSSGGGGATLTLTPPPPPPSSSSRRVGMAMAGRVSPFRESRFSEILE